MSSKSNSSNMDQKHLPKGTSGRRKKNGSGQSGKNVAGPAKISSRPQPVTLGQTIEIPAAEPLAIKKRWYTWPCGRIISGYTTTGAGSSGYLYFLPRKGTDSKDYALPGPIPVCPGQGSSVTTSAPVGSNAMYSLCSLHSSQRNYRCYVHFVAKQPTDQLGTVSAGPVFGSPDTSSLVEWKAAAAPSIMDHKAIACMQGAVTRKLYESFSIDLTPCLEQRGQKRATHGSTTAVTSGGYTNADLNRYVAAWFVVGGDCSTSLQNQETHDVYVSLECDFEDWLGEADAEVTGSGIGSSRILRTLSKGFPSFPVRDTAAVIPAALSTGDDKSGCSAGPPVATPVVTSKAGSTSSTDSATRPISINTNASSAEQGYVVLGQVVQPEKSWFGRLASGQPMK